MAVPLVILLLVPGQFLNWNDLTVNGGTFNANGNAAVRTCAEGSAGNPAHAYEIGSTVITNGEFTGAIDTLSGYNRGYYNFHHRRHVSLLT